ncbi:DUF3179 domain-containing protein [Halostella sp. PRR32]|uniref:DUF3179 domain-containing protein n=1 Tax=Halostella sp. PRR32 TaxID=3098147 RepID=UPI002B1DF3C5|nr:DUF3179 domain-containing protein [Halostella sp. PRR32]
MNVRQVIPRDAIPSVDDPEFVDEYDGDPDDRVVALTDATPPKAYPVRYLHYHEIVNDVIATPEGDRPVAVTWCPLCGSAVVYDREVGRGTSVDSPMGSDGGSKVSTFGVSGKLADDDLVMYDRETESEWKQSSGEAIAGVLAGESLQVLPAAMTTWERFRDSNPDGVVLAPPGGESEASGEGSDPEPIEYDQAPYESYFETEGFGLAAHRGGDGEREWDHPNLDPKDVVLGIERGGDALGVPRRRIEEAGGVVHVAVGGAEIAVFSTADGIHAFETGLQFDPVDTDSADGERFYADGTRWSGATGESRDGRSLDRAPTRRLFAFAWRDDHGDAFFGSDDRDAA